MVNTSTNGFSSSNDELLLFVDLDGTLTRDTINNTFDFLREYLYSRGISSIIRYHLALFTFKFLRKFIRSELLARRFFIILSIFGLSKDEMQEYAIKYWLKIAIKHLNITTLELVMRLKERGYTPILLTACIEIPACVIAKSLNFKDCLCTKFRCLGSIIVGLSEDTFQHLKLHVLKKRYDIKALKNSVYIVDRRSFNDEKPFKIFSEIYVIE